MLLQPEMTLTKTHEVKTGVTFSIRRFSVYRTVHSNSRVKSTTPNNEKESTTNDNGSSTDEAESEGNNRLDE